MSVKRGENTFKALPEKNLIFFALLVAMVFMILSSTAGGEAVNARSFRLIYVVQSGDTLSQISSQYGVSTEQLMSWNDIGSSTSLSVGDELEIPISGEEPERDFRRELTDRDSDLSLSLERNYTVTVNSREEEPDISHIGQEDLITYHVGRGDTLYDIARRFNTSMNVITALNDIDGNDLRQGEEIEVPVTELSEREVLSRTLGDEEFELLARIIHGEARGEPYLGKVAVGAVVINRVLSPRFPETVQEVIYDQGQFSPVQDGSYRQQPDEESRQAAREALDGKDPTGGALFFYNPEKATDREWTQRREKIVTIGDHVFMR